MDEGERCLFKLTIKNVEDAISLCMPVAALCINFKLRLLPLLKCIYK